MKGVLFCTISNTRMDSLEHLLQDIARKVICREVGISTTMCRKFAWSDLNIWPDELPDGKSLVVFSGMKAYIYREILMRS